MTEKPTIEIATLDDLDALARLFDAYRVFYGQESDLARARGFLVARFEEDDSVIFVARHAGEAVGFVQMYPSFSSVSTARIWILNDLFVDRSARRSGVAKGLMQYAADWGRRAGAVRLILETAVDNDPAQSLYASLGWRKVTDFDRFELDLAG